MRRDVALYDLCPTLASGTWVWGEWQPAIVRNRAELVLVLDYFSTRPPELMHSMSASHMLLYSSSIELIASWPVVLVVLFPSRLWLLFRALARATYSLNSQTT